ncbi:trypsin-7-like [Ctenocephalides felis]|uniref:trypsin-7-like n=1 Tax=Ctenocephalides felis TaxID=7515 RepID=UPI000E6E3373|nr:trypsin-7-like [Ctenocephalides felis]
MTILEVFYTYSGKDYTIRAGSNRHDMGGEIYSVIEAVRHPNYNSYNTDNDVALVRVEKPFLLNGKSLREVKLVNSGGNPSSGTLVTATGWGTLEHHGTGTNKLRKVTVPIVDQQKCRKLYDANDDIITSNMVCAGVRGKDSCQGDSGGPLVTEDEILVGIVSFGSGCGQLPGVYTRIASPQIREFINRIAHV